jgi:hypothetical protein
MTAKRSTDRPLKTGAGGPSAIPEMLDGSEKSIAAFEINAVSASTILRKGGLVRDFENFDFLHLEIL